MAMLITSIERMKERLTPESFLAFCTDQGINPDSYVEPEEGVLVDGFDLHRYSAAAGRELRGSVNAFKAAALD